MIPGFGDSFCMAFMDYPPLSICVLKLSAIGDVSHTVPVVRTLQNGLPGARITWVIGSVEAGLVGDLPGVEFITVDKRAGLSGVRALRRRLKGRRFDVLLHMQYALRASAFSTAVRARRRIGLDRARARDGQWLFTNERIAARTREHVMDGLFGFAEALGVAERDLIWDIPVGASDRAFAEAVLPGGRPVLAISPAASNPERNWRAERYAAVADYAVARYGMAPVLCAGPGEAERSLAQAVKSRMQQPAVDLAGRTSLKQLLAVFQRSRCLIAPDSGPAHMGTAASVPVIGLYAVSNPDRTGPYMSRNWLVNRYPENVERFLGKSVEEVPWGARIHNAAGMDRITVADVTARLDGLMACSDANG